MSKQLCFKIWATIALLIFTITHIHAQDHTDEFSSSEIIFVTGLIKNSTDGTLLSSKEINFLDNGVAVIHANVSTSGHYGIAILKEYLAQSTDLVIQIEGFTDYVIENINSLSDYIQLDIKLNEQVSEIEPTTLKKMNEQTTNPFIMRF